MRVRISVFEHEDIVSLCLLYVLFMVYVIMIYVLCVLVVLGKKMTPGVLTDSSDGHKFSDEWRQKVRPIISHEIARDRMVRSKLTL